MIKTVGSSSSLKDPNNHAAAASAPSSVTIPHFLSKTNKDFKLYQSTGSLDEDIASSRSLSTLVNGSLGDLDLSRKSILLLGRKAQEVDQSEENLRELLKEETTLEHHSHLEHFKEQQQQQNPSQQQNDLTSPFTVTPLHSKNLEHKYHQQSESTQRQPLSTSTTAAASQHDSVADASSPSENIADSLAVVQLTPSGSMRSLPNLKTPSNRDGPISPTDGAEDSVNTPDDGAQSSTTNDSMVVTATHSYRHSKPVSGATVSESNKAYSHSPLLERQANYLKQQQEKLEKDFSAKKWRREQRNYHHTALKKVSQSQDASSTGSPSRSIPSRKSPLRQENTSKSSPDPSSSSVNQTMVDRNLVNHIIRQHFYSKQQQQAAYYRPSPNQSPQKKRKRRRIAQLSPTKQRYRTRAGAKASSTDTTASKSVNVEASPQEKKPQPLNLAPLRSKQRRRPSAHQDALSRSSSPSKTPLSPQLTPSTPLPTESLLPSTLVAGDLSFLFSLPSYGPLLKDILTEYEKSILLIKKTKRHASQIMSNIEDKTNLINKEGESKIKNLRDHFDEELRVMRKENQSIRKEIQQEANHQYIQELRFKYQSLLIRKEELSQEVEKEKAHTQNLYEAIRFSRENLSYIEEQLRTQNRENQEMRGFKESYLETISTLDTMPELISPTLYQTELENEKALKEERMRLSKMLSKEQRRAKQLRKEMDGLQNSVRPGIDLEACLQRDRDEIKRTQSPRPDWRGIEEQFNSDSVRAILKSIREFSHMDIDSMSSVEIVSILIEYIETCVSAQRWQVDQIANHERIIELLDPSLHRKNTIPLNDVKEFTGLGTGPEVPKYLRYSGTIRNKQLSKRELENLIEEIWKQRLFQKSVAMRASSRKRPSSFESFFESYLSTQFSNVLQVKREWAYSIVEGCKVYSGDPDCKIFLKVLEGKLSEDAYEGEQQLLENLKSMLEKLDQRTSGINSGKVKKKDIFKRLQKMFRTKSQHNMLILKCMLHFQNPDAIVDYRKLFEDDRNHTQGIFIEIIRNQYVEEVLGYLDQLEDAITDLIDDMTNCVTFSNIHEAFFEIDPLKPKSQIEEIIQKALFLSEPVKWKSHVDADKIINALRKVLIPRSTPVDQVDRIKHKILRRRREKEKRKLLAIQEKRKQEAESDSDEEDEPDDDDEHEEEDQEKEEPTEEKEVESDSDEEEELDVEEESHQDGTQDSPNDSKTTTGVSEKTVGDEKQQDQESAEAETESEAA